jgi:hypothetical protein
MRHLCFATWILLWVCHPCLAGTFAGLEPGVSTQADVERVLGPPLEEASTGGFQFDPARFDAKSVEVFYRPGSEVVAIIAVEPTASYSRSDYREWFGLGEPVGGWRCPEGHWLEVYLPQHIMLHFAGADATHPVDSFGHVDPALAREWLAVEPASEKPDTGELEAYFGVLIGKHQGQGVLISRVNPGSPAERAGLLPGDVILEFGDATFYRSGVESSELAALMAARSPGRPVRVLFDRGTKRLQCQIVPEAKDRASIDAIRQNLFLANYQEGEALWAAGKYHKAIPFLQQATDYNSRDSRSWMLLGFSYLQRGREAEALDAYSKALALMPESPAARYSVAYCHDLLGNREQAAAYYQAYLSAPDQDQQRIKRAQKRLNSFSRKEKQAVDWGTLLIDVASAVTQEVGGSGPSN